MNTRGLARPNSSIRLENTKKYVGARSNASTQARRNTLGQQLLFVRNRTDGRRQDVPLVVRENVGFDPRHSPVTRLALWANESCVDVAATEMYGRSVGVSLAHTAPPPAAQILLLIAS